MDLASDVNDSDVTKMSSLCLLFLLWEAVLEELFGAFLFLFLLLLLFIRFGLLGASLVLVCVVQMALDSSFGE